jgi:hypothetical protein
MSSKVLLCALLVKLSASGGCWHQYEEYLVRMRLRADGKAQHVEVLSFSSVGASIFCYAACCDAVANVCNWRGRLEPYNALFWAVMITYMTLAVH